MKKEDLNDFWDISKLVPAKKTAFEKRSHSYDTEPVEVIIKAKEMTSDSKVTSFDMRPVYSPESSPITGISARVPEKATPDEEYSPKNPFIKSVRIYRRKDFGFYSAFCADGKRLLDLEGRECREPSFFSYVPQYSQLDRHQLEWYLFMRSEIRKKKALSTSYSYLLLYIFELLNVEESKEKALFQLSFIWEKYRAKYPKLDALLPEWITDFCLLHRLSPPASPGGELAERSSLRELFVSSLADADEGISKKELADLLPSICSNYDWKSSKFATGENLSLYETHVKGAILAVLTSCYEKEKLFISSNELKRDAFAGALCTPENKCRIEVSYCSIARSYETRFLITDIIKHTENRIRAYIGVKSRLTVYSLPVSVRACIDAYMDSALPGKRRKKEEAETEEYYRLYDLPKTEFSFEEAKKIEEDSWQTTKILVEAFEGYEAEDEPETVTVKEPEAPTPEGGSDEERLISALTPYIEFIRASLVSDAQKQSEFAQKLGKMTDSVADEINEIAADVYGDIILEKLGAAYTVIEDYREVFENA